MSPVPLRLAVVVVLLGGVAALGGSLDAPTAPAAEEPAQVPVVGAQAVCPDLRQVAGTTVSAVSVGVADVAGDDGAALDAVVTARPLGSVRTATPPVLPVPAEGAAAAALAQDVNGGALAVGATGADAAGLAVQQSALVQSPTVRGLATASCPSPRTDAWLLGGGTRVGERSTLVLANPDLQEAVVDVSALSGEGPVDARPGRGITVPARGRTEVPLEELAPDRSRLAVRVQATRGRVSAVLRHERSDGVVPRGVAYAAPAGEPAEELVVPGMPAGPGGRSVWLVNPGEVDVTAEVEVTTSDGQFVPDGLSGLPVPAGSTVSADLSAVLGATPAALRVRASGPVLAVGVAENAGAGDVRDVGLAGPAGPLGAPVVLSDVVLGAVDTTVLLSALTGDGVVELAVLPVAGAVRVPAAPRRVEVPGGRTVAVRLADLVPAGMVGRVAVQVRPDQRAADVHVGAVDAATRAEGPLLALSTLTAPATSVPQPVVVRDPAVGAGTR
ncbi:MAG: DUF5719 family protein [Actinomycetes bacterium]